MQIDTETFMHETAQMLADGRAVTIPAAGFSMQPFISPGNRLRLKRASSYRKYDIVMAHVEGFGYIVHRIVNILPDGSFALMGDANIKQREFCRLPDICGKLTSIAVGNRASNCERRLFRAKSALWVKALPLRPALLKLWRLFNK